MEKWCFYDEALHRPLSLRTLLHAEEGKPLFYNYRIVLFSYPQQERIKAKFTNDNRFMILVHHLKPHKTSHIIKRLINSPLGFVLSPNSLFRMFSPSLLTNRLGRFANNYLTSFESSPTRVVHIFVTDQIPAP